MTTHAAIEISNTIVPDAPSEEETGVDYPHEFDHFHPADHDDYLTQSPVMCCCETGDPCE